VTSWFGRIFGRSSAVAEVHALPVPGDTSIAKYEMASPPRAGRPSQVIGVPGTAVFGGYPQSLEQNALLNGTRKWTTYANNLANRPPVAAAVRYVLNLVAMPSWHWEPADDTSEAQEIADLTEDIFDDLETPWRRVIKRMAMYRYEGLGWHEWTSKRREDGAIGFLDVAARRPHTLERWQVDETGVVIGVWQRSPQTGVEIYIPRWKSVYLRDDAVSDSPEGVGLFRHIVDACNRLTRYELLEGYGYETDLRGIPYIRAPLLELAKLVEQGPPNGLTAAQRDEILQPLRTAMDNHIRGLSTSVMVDSSHYPTIEGNPSTVERMSFELLRGDSAPHADIAQAIIRANHEIMRVLGAEVLMVGGDGKGSYSLAKDKTQALMVVVDGTLQEIGEAVRKDLVEPLGRLNGWDPALLPWPKIDPLRYRDIEQVTSALAQMAQAGSPMDIDDPADAAVRDVLGLPHRNPSVLDANAADAALLPVMPEPTDPDAGDAERPVTKRTRRPPWVR